MEYTIQPPHLHHRGRAVGLDVTHERIRMGWLPGRYAHRRKDDRIVGAFTSSFDRDFFLTREMTLRFCRTVLTNPEWYPDVLLVLRPKGSELSDPEVRRLLSQAGPRVVLEGEVWTYDLLPMFDLMICFAVSSVGLDGLMAERPVIYFDESEFREHPYERYDPCLVARSPEELMERVEQVLGRGEYVPQETLAHIRNHHGFRFDGKVVERFRQVIYEALESTGGGQGESPSERFAAHAPVARES